MDHEMEIQFLWVFIRIFVRLSNVAASSETSCYHSHFEDPPKGLGICKHKDGCNPVCAEPPRHCKPIANLGQINA